MTNSNNTTESDSVETSSSGDNSQTAPEKDSQAIDWQARAEVAEASNTKLTGERDSANGRVRQLRQERETSSEGFMAGFGNALKEIAQSQERGTNEGLASRVDEHISSATQASSQARLGRQQDRYQDEITTAIAGAGMDEGDASLSEAKTLFNNAQTMAEKAEAVTMVERITNAKKVADANAKATASAQTAQETREQTLKETNAHDLNPPGAGSGGGGANNDNTPRRQVIAQGIEDAGGLEAWGQSLKDKMR